MEGGKEMDRHGQHGKLDGVLGRGPTKKIMAKKARKKRTIAMEDEDGKTKEKWRDLITHSKEQ